MRVRVRARARARARVSPPSVAPPPWFRWVARCSPTWLGLGVGVGFGFA